MSDSTPPILEPARRDDLAEQLRRLWRNGHQPDVAAFLKDAGEVHPAKLAAVFHVDQCERWHRGEAIRAEEYLRRFPAVEAEPDSAVDLIYGEFLLREKYGERPALSEFQYRFPRYHPVLKLQIELHQALAGQDGTQLPTLFDADLPATPSRPLLPGYEILGELGRGGMAVVYKARHLALNRLVAIKMIRAGGDADPEVLRRFQIEAEAIARLGHPNFVAIYDAGISAGQPYLALELVEGGTLVQKAAGVPQSAIRAAQLVETLASAIHEAHRHNLIHRDLKPANVLVTPDGVLKIADFGLVKLVQGAPGLAAATQDTGSGALLGTPRYMAPEQVAFDRVAIGPATDIHALGVMLYELLTGRPPFQGESVLEVVKQIKEDEPLAPRRLQRNIPRDLETICLKCLQKEPARRYTSAAALAEDLRRFLTDEPIRARRTSSAEKVWRWCRRNPARAAATALAGVAILAVVALAIGSAFTVWLHQERGRTQSAWKAAEFQRRLADQTAERLRQERVVSQRLSARLALQRGQSLGERGEPAQGMLWLARALELAPPDDADLQRDIRVNLARWRHSLHLLAAVHPLPSSAHFLFGPEGRSYFTESGDRTPREWSVRTGEQVHQFPRRDGAIVAVSPDRKTFLTRRSGGTPSLWCLTTGKPLRELAQPPGWVHAAAFSADSRFVVLASGARARIYDVETGAVVGMPFAHQQVIHAVAFNSDGKWVVTASSDRTARLWDAATGQAVGPPMTHQGNVYAAVFSPDGKTVLTGSNVNIAQRWDTSSGQPIGEPLVHQDDVLSVAYSPDGRFIATGSEDKTARLWDAETGAPFGPPLPHQGGVFAVAFGPDGHTVLTACADRNFRVWEVGEGKPFGIPLQHQGLLMEVAFSPDGKTVATASLDRTARLWEAATGRELLRFIGHTDGVWAVAYSPNGELLATGGHDGTARRWSIATGKPLGGPLMHNEPRVERVVFSPNGRWLATASQEEVRLWQAETGRPGPALPHRKAGLNVAFSPDSRTVFTTSPTGKGQLWDVATGKPLGAMLEHPIRGVSDHPRKIRAFAFSPDGQTILTAGQDGTARLWDAATGEPIGKPMLHDDEIDWFFAAAFSRDGKLIATGSKDETARLWNAATGEPIGLPMRHQGKVWAVAFDPLGKVLLTGSTDGTARLWDTESALDIGPPLQHRGRVRVVAFSPDGQRIVTASGDQTARLWELPTSVNGRLERIILWVQTITGLELTSEGEVRVLDAGRWHERRQVLTELGGPP